MSRRRLPGLVTAAATAALAAALLTPGTRGTFSAVVGTSGGAAVNPYLICSAAVDAERAGGSLVFAYPLTDQAGSAQAADSGSTGPAAYTGAMATTAEPGMPCRRDGGTAWAPDGSTSGLALDPVALRSRFTFEVRFRTTQANAVIASIQPTQFAGVYALAVSNGGVALLSPSGPLVGGGSGAGDGAWHHLALVIDGANGIRLYLDSVQIAFSPFDMPDNFAVRWRLAVDESRSLGVPRLQGAMRWAVLTSRALTAEEVHAHDQAGRTPVLRGRVAAQAAPTATSPPTPAPTDTAAAVASASTPTSTPSGTAESARPADSAQPADSPSAAPSAQAVPPQGSAQAVSPAQPDGSAQPEQPSQSGAVEQTDAGGPDVLIDQGG